MDLSKKKNTDIIFEDEGPFRNGKLCISIQDGARYHTSAALNKCFAENKDRSTIYDLPSYFSHYTPIDKLRGKMEKGSTHPHCFSTFNALVDKVEKALLVFIQS